MIKMAQYFEGIGLHRSADVALQYAMRREAQFSSISRPSGSVTIGQFFQNAQFGDYLSILRNELAPFVQQSHLGELLQLIVNSPIQDLYKKLREIQYTPAQQNRVPSFGPKGKNPSIVSVGQDPAGTSDIYKNRQDLRVFVKALTDWGLELAGLHGLLTGYGKMTGLSANVAKNPSPFQASFEPNTTMGAQFGVPNAQQPT